MSILLIAAAAGVTFADMPDKFVEDVESSGVQYVDTAGRNASLGNFTVTSGGELVKTGEGTLAMTSFPALEKISLANGALTVAAEAASLDALDLATGTRCDLGGGALACGVLSGSGTVANGAVAVAGAISVKVGEPLTFSAALKTGSVRPPQSVSRYSKYGL